MSDELDPKDRALLQDIAAFNREYAAAGWHIQNKDITEDLSRIALRGSSVESSQFPFVSWTSAQITDSQFTNVEFQNGKFTDAIFRNVVFTNCKFLLCSFEKARLTKCRFIHCAAEDLSGQEAVFEDCVFERFEDNAGVFESAAISNCTYESCQMQNSAFYSTQLNSVSLKRSALKDVVFTDIKGTELLFEDTAIEYCGLVKSRYGSVTIQGGRSEGLTFKQFNPERIVIRNCVQIDSLAVRDSTWAGAMVTDCPAVSELTIDGSRMKDLTIDRCGLQYFRMEETEVSGKSRIADCAIAGLNLEKSTLVRMEMTGCSVSDYLAVDGATSDGVVLRGITYAPDLTFSAKGVKYLNGSSEFHRKSPSMW